MSSVPPRQTPPARCRQLLPSRYHVVISHASGIVWHNLETLLKIGDKYELSALLQQIKRFISSNAHQLKLTASDECFAWKWVLLADKYYPGLFATVRHCLDSQNVHELVKVCPKEQLHELCGGSLQHLIQAMSSGHQHAPSAAQVSVLQPAGRPRGVPTVYIPQGVSRITLLTTPASAAAGNDADDYYDEDY